MVGFLVLVLAGPAVAPVKIVVPEGKTSIHLFESPESAIACLDASDRALALIRTRRAVQQDAGLHASASELTAVLSDLDKKAAEAVALAEHSCDEAQTGPLVAGTEVRVLKRNQGMVQIKVLTGRQGGKVGWVMPSGLQKGAKQ